MAELSHIGSGHLPANRSRIQQNVLEDQVELWWFQDVKLAILCYSAALLLIFGTGIAGIVIMSTATTHSGEWRLGVGMALCLLCLIVLFKQLLTSALQDMNCVRSRAQIYKLRSGGLIDYLVILFTGFIVLTCGYTLTIVANSKHHLSFRSWTDQLIVGVILTVAGSVILLLLGVYVLIFKLYPYIKARFAHRMEQNIFTISGSNIIERQPQISTSTSNLL
ncbi:transmembrane protein 125-like [Narcine bancroftii]|uniref:transmembrane protein 125-like n=1 Tax=Narcine bancroftii TaxID=1343680 RepID=UPI0038321953